jgi:hypothetical protein
VIRSIGTADILTLPQEGVKEGAATTWTDEPTGVTKTAVLEENARMAASVEL